MARVSGKCGKAYRLPLTHRVKDVLTFVLLTVIAHAAFARDCSVDWTMLAPGIDYRKINCPGDDIDVHVVRVDPDQWEFNTAPRAGVWIQKDGSLLFFATPHTGRLQMTEIARIAGRAESDGGLACEDAMLFDGGHSVNLSAGADHRRIDVEGDPVPVFLYATPNNNAQ